MKEKTGPTAVLPCCTYKKNISCSNPWEKTTPFLPVSKIPTTPELLVAVTAFPNSRVLSCLPECWPLLATSATAILPTFAHLYQQQSACSLHCHRWAEMTRGAWEATTAGDSLPIIPDPFDVSLPIYKSKVTTVGVLSSSLKSSVITQPWHWRLLCGGHL